ncbi:GntR family transcriptional regulator [Kineosporia sp. R_H_3]|uniref:GntR family transcriptional regulator n=1 Tax=Kineosporia sp. R_H_3 TaxID=1961848 RepID=UPI0018E99CAA|nr:GntR family transcriptional regulator [Kineosporia sp. R_H_3]
MSVPAVPEPIERPRSLADLTTVGGRLGSAVYDLLKERLLEGTYSPGQKLRMEELRQEFGVSKQPVMEALRRLSAERLVEIVPQVGCTVMTYSADDVADFYAMFGGFEGAIAAAAAERRSDAQLDELRRVHDRIGALRNDPDPAARSHGYRVYNREFHGVVHRMAHSRIMSEMSQRMWDLSDFLINTTGAPQPLASALVERHDDHQRILDALRDHDTETARTEMQNHIAETVGIIKAESKH